MNTPVVYQYQQALDEFRREGREPPLLKRMSELISLLDLTTTLGSTMGSREILDAALLIVMGELQVSRGGLFVRDAGDLFVLRSGRGLAPGSPTALQPDPVPEATTVPGPADEAAAQHGFEILCPVRKGGRTIALIGLGPRQGGRPYAREETGFLESLAACAATPIENGLMYEELRKVNGSLSMKVFQLHNLFDISRELTASLDEPSIRSLVTATVLGQFLVSRCALFVLGDDGLQLGHARGLPAGLGFPPVPAAEARAFLGALRRPRPVAELDAGPLREALERARLVLVVPLTAGERASGLLAIGERSSGAGLTEEDLDFAQALARQAQAALEGARLHRVRLEKERQDRELQIAREIQQSLFPRGAPELPGMEVVAESRSCYQVGGDYYDFIPLADGRLAVVIADVSGKGTPASILMASVHASLQAMAGSARPTQMLERLNRFLYANTQASRYVTLFYAELDPGRSRLEYVNAGHVPPYLLGADGRVERLTAGGPVLGLLEDVALEPGTVHLVSGDLVAAVTDGVTEALSPAGEELGDDRVCRALGSAGGAGAKEVLRSLVAAVDAWTGPAGSTDDLTALIVRAL